MTAKLIKMSLRKGMRRDEVIQELHTVMGAFVAQLDFTDDFTTQEGVLSFLIKLRTL